MGTLSSIKKIGAVLLIVLMQFIFVPVSNVQAASGASPDLGNAGSFAVLAGTAITNVPTSVITGDVGLSPAAGNNYSGLTNAEVSGTIYAPDSSGPAGATGNNPGLLTNAKTDLTAAFTNLALGANANANCDPSYLFGSDHDLSGASLPPGVYCSDNFTLTGTLTLTGSGVWVFRSAGTLITSGTANIVGGSPCDVWWQVGSSATLGTNTSLIGNILALTSISMNTGATLNGRALARNGAVTLQSNTINQSCTSTLPRLTFGAASPGSGGGAVYCPPFDSNIVGPIIIDSRRVDADSVFISWGPYSGINTFLVEYGTENGKWLYNTKVTGFSTTLNNLPANTPIWVRITATDYCSQGVYGEATLVGATSVNTLIPRLPNTGGAPKKDNFLQNITAGVYAVSSFLIKLLHI